MTAAADDGASRIQLRREARRAGLLVSDAPSRRIRIWNPHGRQLLAEVADVSAALLWLRVDGQQRQPAEGEAQRSDEERATHAFKDAQALLAMCGVPCWRTDPADGARVYLALVDSKPVLLLVLADLAALAARLEERRQLEQEAARRGRVFQIRQPQGHTG